MESQIMLKQNVLKSRGKKKRSIHVLDEDEGK